MSVQMDTLFGHFLRLACRPTDLTIALVVSSFFPRDSNLGWGDWRRSLLVVVFVFGFVYGQFLCQCALLVTRLG